MNVSFDLNNIVETHILRAGGIIFGSYVKDKIIIEKNKKSFKKQDKDRSNFFNPSYLPEFKDRLMIPKSLECIMTDEQFVIFKTILEYDKMSIDSIANGEYLIQFAVHKCLSSFFNYKMKVVIELHSSKNNYSIKNKFNALDCMNLLIIGGQIALNQYIYKDLSILENNMIINTIMHDIMQKETTISKTCKGTYSEALKINVFCKMSGFKIKNENFNMIYQKSEVNICLLCQKSTQNTIEVRRNCCEYCIHTECLAKSQDLYTCPCCATKSQSNVTDSIFIII